MSAFPPIGERLREARLRRGLTVRGLARAVEVSASLISQIETGKSSPSVSTLYAITAALGISVEDVFGDPDTNRRRDAGSAPVGVTSDAVVRTNAAVPASAGLTAPALTGRSWEGTSAFDPDVHQNGPSEQLANEWSAALSAAQGLRKPQPKRRVGPVVRPDARELLTLDSGVTWEMLGQMPDAHVEFLRITYAPGGSSSGAGVLMRHSGTEYGHVLAGQLTLTLGFDTYVLNPGDSVSFDCSTPHSYANHGSEPAVGVWFVAERPH